MGFTLFLYDKLSIFNEVFMFYSGKRIQEILSANEPMALDDISELEDIVGKINELDKKESFYEDLKRKRSKVIEDEISKVKSVKEFLRKVVSKTLEKNNEESISFPGVGTVSQSKPRSTWIIKDEQEFVKLLKDNIPADKISDYLITKDVLNKRKVDDLLDKLELSDELPSFVVKETGEDSIKIRFNKDLEVKNKDEVTEEGI